jgi:hypothetical protein
MVRKRRWLPFVLVATCWTALHGQDSPASRFEVATVKPHPPDSRTGFGTEVYPGGRVIISAISLKGLAFRHEYAQIANADGLVRIS